MSFHTGFKDCYGRYTEVFKNPSSREAHAIESWKECGAIRGYITKGGDLYLWDAHTLHTDAYLALEFKLSEVLPVVLSKNQVYVTDGIRYWTTKNYNTHLVPAKKRLTAILETYKVQKYGDEK